MNSISTPLGMMGTLLAFLFVATAANAQTNRGAAPGFYLGAGAGVAALEDNVELNDLDDVDLDDDGTAFKIFGGWRANANVAIEGGYRTFGEADVGPFTVETDGLDMAVVGIIPIGPFDLFAKGGVMFWETDGDGPIPDFDGQDLIYGIGGQFNLGSLFVRIESEWFDFDFPEEAQMFTGSVGFRF